MSSPIVEDYESSIRELTFNSRPIIDNLTIIAKENTQAAPGIVRVISNRIYKSIPEQKLFALYLLDSVCKIVGPPYSDLFGEEIFKLFSHVYLLVNESTRTKLAKIYELWRVLKSRGLDAPLFPPEQMDRIGNFLRQAGYRRDEGMMLAPGGAFAESGPSASGVSAAALVADIDALLPLLQQKAAARPSDLALPGKCSALSELRALLLGAKLLQKDLMGILAKLLLMKLQEMIPLVNGARKMDGVAHGDPAPARAPSKADTLFGELIASGLVKMDQSLKPGSKPEYELVHPKRKFSPGTNGFTPSTQALEQLLNDATLSGKSQYEQIKFKELVKVAQKLEAEKTPRSDKLLFSSKLQSFIKNTTLDASTIQVLYETKALKCAQCGKRFTADDAGNAKKRVHLDWHFRINKRHTNFKANVQSRNWYLDEIAWVQFRDDDLLEYESTASQPKRDEPVVTASLAQSYVAIPSSETNMNNVCTICREQVKPVYKDLLGEWVWDECLLVPGPNTGRKIVHVGCFAEADRKRTSADDTDRNVKRKVA